MQDPDFQNVRIDIHTAKLIEWLVSRRHCNKDWQKILQTIRAKINNAIQDMPATEEMTKLLKGTYINYFHCLKIVEILKETESGTKNIFGRYSSQRMKDWQEIVKLYEKDNVYLADVSSTLIRNVKYDIPGMKRQIENGRTKREECIKRKEELAKSAIQFTNKFHYLCKELGIEGKNVRRELLDLIHELPSIFEELVRMSQEAKDAIAYYIAFTEFVLNCKVDERAVLPMLKYVIEKGNTTTYEWRTGHAPDKILEYSSFKRSIVDEPELDLIEETADNNDAIDFGDDDGGIDFGEEAATTATDGEEIDWGITAESSESSDWAITTVDDLDSGSTHEKTKEGSRVAKGQDALSIMDNTETRNLFINDLLELEAFLEQRMEEMKGEDDLVGFSQFQAAPHLLQIQTDETVAAMLQCIKLVQRHLNDERTQQLLLIKESPSYVDRLTKSLMQNLKQAKTCQVSQDALTKRFDDYIVEEEALKPKIKLLMERSGEIQKQIEDDISKKYNNRPVKIIAGLNLLQQ